MPTADKWEQLYESLKSRVTQLESDNRMLMGQVELLQAEKKQWEIEKISQQKIIQTALANSNSVSNAYLEEIKELRVKLEALKESK